LAAAEPKTLGDPARDAYAVTPADSDLPWGLCAAIWVGGTGNVVVYTGTTSTTALTFTVANAPCVIPVQARQIRAASTATNIVALY
jgi:hypothetical protein